MAVLLILAAIVVAVVASPAGPVSRAAVEELVCRVLTPPGQSSGGCERSVAMEVPPAPPPGQPVDPCVRRSTGGSANVGASIMLVDVGDGTGFVVEELSDATYRVSWANESLTGLTAALVQGKGTVRIGDRTVGVEGEVSGEGALVATFGDTRTFASEEEALSYIQDRWWDETIRRAPPVYRDLATGARSIVDWITGHEREEGTPQDTSAEVGVRVGGGIGADLGDLGGEVAAAGEGAVKVTTNVDGSRSILLALSREGSGNLGVPILAELGAAAGGTSASSSPSTRTVGSPSSRSRPRCRPRWKAT